MKIPPPPLPPPQPEWPPLVDEYTNAERYIHNTTLVLAVAVYIGFIIWIFWDLFTGGSP